MLTLAEVSHAYGDVVSLRAVSLSLQPGEILCLLGPSGCGKTTLLRLIAGLEAEYSGSISFEGQDLSALPVHQRGFGLMFQDFALFPHLDVAGNIAYGLKQRGISREARTKITRDLAARIGLAGLEKRDVAALSGGQKQRVALARSLAPEPRLLMLDEPLGSLDAPLRDALALELRRIIKQQGISAIYVTHDHREAYAVADRIGVMRRGALEQLDAPHALYQRPKTAFVARFLGMTNIFPRQQNAFTQALAAASGIPRGQGEIILVHPGGIALNSPPRAGAMQAHGKLSSAVFRGDYYDVAVTAAEGMRLAFPVKELAASIGAKVSVSIDYAAVIALRES